MLVLASCRSQEAQDPPAVEPPGLVAEVHDTIVRNNTVFSEFAGTSLAEHDVGIIIERGSRE